MINIEKIRKEFSFFDNNKDTTYLDTAASALKLDKMTNLLDSLYKKYGVNVYRGLYKQGYVITELYEQARQKVAKFINCDENEIVFTKGTTQSLNIIGNSAYNFISKGQDLITTELEHNSSILPWLTRSDKIGFNVKYIPLDKDNRITVDGFKKVLSDNTKVVVITHVSNVLGYITPVKQITKLAHEKGAIVILDCAQSAPHIKIDVKDLDVDFLAFSGHKMYGPTGIGILYGKYNLLKKLDNFEVGGEMVDLVTKDEIIYKMPPHNLEAGTPPIYEAISLCESLEFLDKVGFDNIQKHEQELKEYCIKELKKIKHVTIYNEKTDTGIISFNVEDLHPHDVISGYDEHNVCMRAGHHCAGLYAEKLGLKTGMLRISFGVYTSKEDIDKFIDVTKKIVKFFKGSV